MVSELETRLEGLGFESHPTLDGNGVKAMIPALNPGQLTKKDKKEKYRYPNGA